METSKPFRVGPWIGYLFMTGFFVFVAMQINATKREIAANSEFANASIEYSALIPDKKEYAPGELVHFTYTRTALKTGKYPLLIQTLDSFENKNTGEVYPGTLAQRVIKESSIVQLKATRKLAEFASPGTYVLEGGISSHTNRLTRSIYYTSEPFEVVASH